MSLQRLVVEKEVINVDNINGEQLLSGYSKYVCSFLGKRYFLYGLFESSSLGVKHIVSRYIPSFC